MSEWTDRCRDAVRYHPAYRPASLALFAVTTLAVPFCAAFAVTRHLLERRNRR